jgi:hypothetical protein
MPHRMGPVVPRTNGFPENRGQLEAHAARCRRCIAVPRRQAPPPLPCPRSRRQQSALPPAAPGRGTRKTGVRGRAIQAPNQRPPVGTGVKARCVRPCLAAASTDPVRRLRPTRSRGRPSSRPAPVPHPPSLAPKTAVGAASGCTPAYRSRSHPPGQRDPVYTASAVTICSRLRPKRAAGPPATACL